MRDGRRNQRKPIAYMLPRPDPAKIIIRVGYIIHVSPTGYDCPQSAHVGIHFRVSVHIRIVRSNSPRIRNRLWKSSATIFLVHPRDSPLVNRSVHRPTIHSSVDDHHSPTSVFRSGGEQQCSRYMYASTSPNSVGGRAIISGLPIT